MLIGRFRSTRWCARGFLTYYFEISLFINTYRDSHGIYGKPYKKKLKKAYETKTRGRCTDKKHIEKTFLTETWLLKILWYPKDTISDTRYYLDTILFTYIYLNVKVESSKLYLYEHSHLTKELLEIGFSSEVIDFAVQDVHIDKTRGQKTGRVSHTGWNFCDEIVK